MADSVFIDGPIGDELAELIASRFQTLAEPTRLRLLDALRDGPATVGELQERIGSSQQNVSKHLGILHRAGLVSRRKEGTSSVYTIADESVFALCEQVCGGVQRQVDGVGALLAS